MNNQDFKLRLIRQENRVNRKLNKKEIAIMKTIYSLQPTEIVEIEIQIGYYEYKFLARYMLSINENNYRFAIAKTENYGFWEFASVLFDRELGWIIKGGSAIKTTIHPLSDIPTKITKEFIDIEYQFTILNIKKTDYQYTITEIHDQNKDFYKDLVVLKLRFT